MKEAIILAKGKILVQRVAIVTGASFGIGEAIARALAAQGYALVLAARSADALTRLAGELTRSGATALPVPTDVTRTADLERLVRLALEHYGRIDLLVNNAGISETHRSAPHSDGSADLTIHTNLLAPIYLSRLVVPIMVAQRSGHIINITSVAGHIGLPGRESYAASKHGLRGFSEALRRELRSAGVRVSMVSPGFIRTNMTSEVGLPMPGPELIGRTIVKVLRKPQAEMVVPGWYRPAMWLNWFAPQLLDAFLTSAVVRFLRREKRR